MSSEFEDSERYLPIAINSFITTSQAPADLYLKVSDRMIRVIKKDDVFDLDRLRNYEGHKITHLYVSSRDMSSMSQKSTNMLAAANKIPGFNNEKKLALLRNAAEFVGRNLLNGDMSQTDIEVGKEFLGQSFDVITTMTDLTPLLNAMQEMDEIFLRHSVSVAMYAMILAQRSGFTTRNGIVTFGIGGLLHDIGFRELETSLMTKDSSTMTPQDRARYESHVDKGHQIARRYRSLTSDIRQIIFQHHELPDGHGFPQGLRGSAIFPAARTINLADQLAHLTVPIRLNETPVTISQAVESILGSQSQDYSENVIAGLEEFL